MSVPIVIPVAGGGGEIASGSFTPASTVDSYAINVGFQPDFIVVYCNGSSVDTNSEGVLIYDFGSSSGVEAYKTGGTWTWKLPKVPSYSSETVTIYCQRYGEARAPYFVSGKTYTWFAMKA